MIEPISMAGPAIVEKIFDRFWGQRQERKQLIDDVVGTRRTALREPIERWLEHPITWHQLLSDDESVRRLAIPLLRDRFEDAGVEPPDDLEPIIASAHEALLARQPAAPEVHKAKAAILEAQAASREAQAAGFAGLEERLDGLSDRLRPGREGPLAAQVEDALGQVQELGYARRLRALLVEQPTGPGFRRLLSQDHPLAGADHHLWEAAAREASGRGLYAVAADLWSRAAAVAPDPARSLAYEALVAELSGDDERARARSEQAVRMGTSPLVAAVEARVNGDWDGLAAIDAEQLDPRVRDHRVAAMSVIEALVRTGDVSNALRLAERMADEDPAAPSVQLAGVLLARVASGQSPDRTADLNRAYRLAEDARATLHSWGWPAPDAVRIMMHIAVNDADLETVLELARDAVDSGFTQELDDPGVAEQVTLAERVTGEDVGHEVHLREFHRRFFAAVGPSFVSAEDPDEGYAERLRHALGAAENDTDLARVLQAMARIGVVPAESLDDLASRQPVIAEAIRARQLAAEDEVDGAIRRLRPYLNSHDEAAITAVQILDAAGRHEDAVDAAVRSWDHLEDLSLLTLALEIAGPVAQDLHADTIERLDQAVRQALGRVALTDDQRVRLLRRTVAIAAANDRWGDVVDACRQLRQMDDTRLTRWQLTLGYVNTGRLDDAWATVIGGGDLLEPVDIDSLDLLARLAGNLSDDPAHVHALLDYAERFDEDTGTIVLAAFVLSTRLNDPNAGRRAYEALDSYVDDHPETELVRRVSTEELQDDPQRFLEQFAPAPTEQVRDLERGILIGQLPFTYATFLVNRPVSELLATRDSGVLNAASQTLHDRARDRGAAEAALDERVVLDITGVYVLAQLELAMDRGGGAGPAAELLAHFDEVCVPVDVALDAANARASLAHDAVATVVPPREPDEPHRIVEIDDETLQRRRRVAETMAALADRLPRVDLPADLQLADDPPPPVRAGLGAAEVAMASGLPAWIDDGALRLMLRDEDVQTFGTRALLDVLRDNGRMGTAEHARWVRALRQARVADLPFPYDDVLELAEAGGFFSGPASIPLMQPGWWSAKANTRDERVFALFEKIASENAQALSAWMHNAALGFGRLGDPYKLGSRLLVLLVARADGLGAHAQSLVDGLDAALRLLGRPLQREDLTGACQDLMGEGATSTDAEMEVERLLPDVELTK